jgi:hypothetical protein
MSAVASDSEAQRALRRVRSELAGPGATYRLTSFWPRWTGISDDAPSVRHSVRGLVVPFVVPC